MRADRVPEGRVVVSCDLECVAKGELDPVGRKGGLGGAQDEEV